MKHSSQCHVEAQDEADEAASEKDERSLDVDPNQVQLAAVVRSEMRRHHCGLLSIWRLLRNPIPNDRRVRLPKERQADQTCKRSYRCNDDEDPLEPDGLSNEPSGDGPHSRTDERA